MREFLLDIFTSLLLVIFVLIIYATAITFILWDYTWMFTDTGITSIRISAVVIFILGIYDSFSEFKKEKLKEHDEKISN